jgi:hypothetical protein
VTGFQEDLLVNLEVTKWFKHSYREMEVQERPYLLAHLTRLVSKMKAFIVEALKNNKISAILIIPEQHFKSGQHQFLSLSIATLWMNSRY